MQLLRRGGLGGGQPPFPLRTLLLLWAALAAREKERPCIILALRPSATEKDEVAAQGHRERKLVHQVHGRAGHHGSAAQVLQAQHLGEKRSPTKCLLSWTRPTTGHRATSAQPPSPPRRRAQALATAHLPHRAGHGSAHPAAFVSNSVCPRPETPPPSLPPALREDGPRGPLRTRDHRLGAVTKILQMCAKDGPPLSCSADVDGKRR